MTHFYPYIGKRIFALALPAMIILSPLIACIGALVPTKIGSPRLLFRQMRPGFGGVLFTIYKFRTMTDEWNVQVNLLPGGEGLPRFGRFFRTTSLDLTDC